MKVKLAIGTLAAAAVVVAFLILGSGGPADYRLMAQLDNTGGLRTGSAVVVGGVPVGNVELAVDRSTRKIRAEIAIKPQYAPMGKDVRGAIVSQNLLGQKQLELQPGDRSKPAKSGASIPSEQISTSADLDQLLDVLDSSTRTRLAIFINEAGAAFTGRRADFNTFLHDVQPAFGSLTQLLAELDSHNLALRNLLSTSDRYVDEVTRERRGLERLVDRVGGTAATVSVKRAELRQTLADAPAALTTLRSFLGKLQETTVPLGPAARQLSASAPPLRAALEKIEPFQQAADPALDAATAVAPALTRAVTTLGPTLIRARPAVRQVRRTATLRLPGVASALKGSIQNTVSVLENWSRVVEYRDKLGHVFRGEASIAPDLLTSAVNRLVPGDGPVKRTGRSRRDRPQAQPQAPVEAPTLPPLHLPAIKPVPDLQHIIDGAKGKLPKTPAVPQPAQTPAGTNDLLDFLLGN